MTNATLKKRKALGTSAILASILVGVNALFWHSAVHAGSIYSTGFEAPAFTAGELVAGQDGWTSRFGKPIGTIETDVPRSGSQYLRAVFSDFPSSPAPIADEAFRPIVNYDAIANGTPLLNLSVDARLDGPVISDDVINAVFEAIPADIDAHGFPFGQFSISADGNLYVYGSQFDDFLIVSGIQLGRYYHLEMILDFPGRQTIFLLDGIALATFAFSNEIQSTILDSAAVDALAINDAALLSGYTARFDNYSISAVPEPTTSSFLALGLAFFYGRVRHHRNRSGS